MIHSIKILVVDDEGVIAEHLKVILNSLGFSYVQLANNKEKALLLMKDYAPDLVLLDIRMEEELDGIEIAEIINTKYKTPFIFITAHSDAVILKKALEKMPAAYITKPFKKMDIYAAMNIAIANKILTHTETLIIKDGIADIKIEVDTILFVQSERNYIDIICAEERYSIRNTLEWFAQSTSEKKFMRVHRSYIVNLRKIKKMTRTHITINDVEIPVSRKYVNELRKIVVE
jgi:two-component system, LytTR family, response regulator LytT